MAIVRPIVECNRIQIDNGRSYLREMAFGDPDEPQHAEALAIAARTGEAIAGVLHRARQMAPGKAANLARIVSAIMFVSMASSANAALSVDQIVDDIREQVRDILER